MQYEIARKLYEEIKEKAAKETDSDIEEVYKDFIKYACDYADNRKAWSFMSRSEQIADDASRSIKHNAYMSMLESVCNIYGIDGVNSIMPDRKAKGDFACYIALFLSLEQR